jgi:hypothetical protein
LRRRRVSTIISDEGLRKAREITRILIFNKKNLKDIPTKWIGKLTGFFEGKTGSSEKRDKKNKPNLKKERKIF